MFGKNPANEFIEREGLKGIVRAHEQQPEGYKEHRWNGEDKPAPVITVFSAPNYCNKYMNSAAIFITDGQGHNFKVFEETQLKPFELPVKPLSDAITFFMDDFCAILLDMVHSVSKSALKCVDETTSNALSQSSSIDESYINKLIEKSE